MRCLRTAGVLAASSIALSALVVSAPQPAQAADICGCKRVSTGRVNRITADIPPNPEPICKAPSRVVICWPDQASAGTGSVTSITAGNGLQATPNPITNSGTISVNASMCSAATDKLLWDGSAFQCGVDQDQPPADISAKVTRPSGDFFVPENQLTAIEFNVELFDTDNIFDAGQPTRLTAQTAGKYYIFGQADFESNPTGQRELRITKSTTQGTTQIARVAVPATGTTQGTVLIVSTYENLSSGNYVELQAYHQGSGGALGVCCGIGEGSGFGMVKLP